MTLAGGILGFEFQYLITSVATAFIGSYITVRSLSLIFGGFPNELELSQQLQTGVYSSLPWYVYIYLLLIAGLFAVGMYVQISTHTQDLQTVVKNEKMVGLLTKAEKRIR